VSGVPPSAPPPTEPPAGGTGPRRDETKAIVAIVLGASGLLPPLVVPSIVGLVLGLPVRRRAEAEGDQANRTRGTWAVALSCLALAYVVLLVGFIVMLGLVFKCPPPTGNATADAAACPPM